MPEWTLDVKWHLSLAERAVYDVHLHEALGSDVKLYTVTTSQRELARVRRRSSGRS
ncbi:MAG: hypothetical protein OXH77_00430 [Anaerolineaceae bacterium]|nr:hypothetical protein [Anaerolineaceae bacterium]